MTKKNKDRAVALARKVKLGKKSLGKAARILIEKGVPYNVAYNQISSLVNN